MGLKILQSGPKTNQPIRLNMPKKETKGKPILPTDQSLMKILYLETMNAIKKWSMGIRNWYQIKNELSIFRDNS